MSHYLVALFWQRLALPSSRYAGYIYLSKLMLVVKLPYWTLSHIACLHYCLKPCLYDCINVLLTKHAALFNNLFTTPVHIWWFCKLINFVLQKFQSIISTTSTLKIKDEELVVLLVTPHPAIVTGRRTENKTFSKYFSHFHVMKIQKKWNKIKQVFYYDHTVILMFCDKISNVL